MTLDFKTEGDLIYLIGESYNDLASSEYIYSFLQLKNTPAPRFNLDEECLLHITVEGLTGGAREAMLATKDTPAALKAAWDDEENRRRLQAERTQETEAGRPKGLFASIRKVFSGD